MNPERLPQKPELREPTSDRAKVTAAFFEAASQAAQSDEAGDAAAGRAAWDAVAN